jgi:hypothetical protein
MVWLEKIRLVGFGDTRVTIANDIENAKAFPVRLHIW